VKKIVIEVKIPSEIRDYKGKMVAGLTTRQLFGIFGALAIGVPLGVLGHNHISGEILPWLIILTSAPFAGIGFMAYKGMKFEEFVKVIYNFYFCPQKRVYEDVGDNIFSFFKMEITEKEIIKQRINNGESEEDIL
jgi:hypothetical protein